MDLNLTDNQIKELLREEDRSVHGFVNVRCFTCGKVIDKIYHSYEKLRKAGSRLYRGFVANGATQQEAIDMLSVWQMTYSEVMEALNYDNISPSIDEYQNELTDLEGRGLSNTPEYHGAEQALDRETHIQNARAKLARKISDPVTGMVGLLPGQILDFLFAGTRVTRSNIRKTGRWCCRSRVMTPTPINMNRDAKNIDWQLVEGTKDHTSAMGEAFNLTGMSQSLEHDTITPYSALPQGSRAKVFRIGESSSSSSSSIVPYGTQAITPFTPSGQSPVTKSGEKPYKLFDAGSGVTLKMKRSRVYIAR